MPLVLAPSAEKSAALFRSVNMNPSISQDHGSDHGVGSDFARAHSIARRSCSSRKRRSDHFGSGASHAHRVMRQHHGRGGTPFDFAGAIRPAAITVFVRLAHIALRLAQCTIRKLDQIRQLDMRPDHNVGR